MKRLLLLADPGLIFFIRTYPTNVYIWYWTPAFITCGRADLDSLHIYGMHVKSSSTTGNAERRIEFVSNPSASGSHPYARSTCDAVVPV